MQNRTRLSHTHRIVGEFFWRRDNPWIVPKWYHGHCYFDASRNEQVMALVGLHWIVQLIWWFNWKYCAVTKGKSWIDREVEKRFKHISKEFAKWQEEMQWREIAGGYKPTPANPIVTRAMNPREGDVLLITGEGSIKVCSVGDGQVWYKVSKPQWEVDRTTSLDDWPGLVRPLLENNTAVFIPTTHEHDETKTTDTNRRGLQRSGRDAGLG